MKSVVVIHAVKSTLNSFDSLIKSAIPGVVVHNIYDDFFSTDPEITGDFSMNNKNRLFYILKAAELTGAKVILVACSNPVITVELLKPFISIPILCINDAMAQKAVDSGNRITILATALGTVAPSKEKIESIAFNDGKEVKIDIKICTEAYDAMKSGNMAFHDSEIKKMAAEVKDADVVVLAQASMAHLEKEIRDICNCTVFSSTASCIERLKEVLGDK